MGLKCEDEKMSLLTWIDIETTGLPELSERKVYEHKILEIAIVVTDTYFRLVDSIQLVIAHDAEIVNICDEYVRNTHTENGLFEDCMRSELTLSEAQAQCVEFLKRSGVPKGQSPLCGSSIFLDRAFIAAQMPILSEYLHYRSLDVTSVSLFLDSLGFDAELKKSSSHRAMDDILASINNAKRFKSMLIPS